MSNLKAQIAALIAEHGHDEVIKAAVIAKALASDAINPKALGINPRALGINARSLKLMRRAG